MVLGSTTAMWGLLGMLVPLVIHLLSKRKQEEIYFGSIQFLEETASDRSRSIQLSQYLLLASRMVIIGLITMMAAELFYNTEDKSMHKVFVPQELIDNSDYSSLMANYNGEVYELVPYHHDVNSNCEQCFYTPTLNTLLHSANQHTDSSTVISFGYKRDILGIIPSISKRTQVIQIPEMETADQHEIVIGDSLYQLNTTDLDNNLLLGLSAGSYNEEREEITICLYGSEANKNEMAIMQNIVASISAYIKYPVSYTCDNPQWVITIDTLVSQGQAKMIHWDVNNKDLTWAHDGWSNYNISGQINTKGLRATNLPVLMAEVLSTSQINYEEYDSRTINLAEQIDNSLEQVALADVGKTANVSKYLWLLLLLALYGERRLSNQNAGVA